MTAETVDETHNPAQDTADPAAQRVHGVMRARRRARGRDLIEIQSWDEVPAFASEAEEAEYWGTHGLGEELIAQFETVPPDGGGELPPARAETIPYR